jgi:hypothetical protein
MTQSHPVGHCTFSPFGIPGKLGCSCKFFLGFSGDLFRHFLGAMITLPSHEDF